MFVFSVVMVLLTIFNTPYALSIVSSEELKSAKVKFGSIRFTVDGGDGECKGNLITKQWVIADPQCVGNATKLHLTKLALKRVSLVVDIEESHLTDDPETPENHYFVLMKAREVITNEEFSYLPLDSPETWENLKQAAKELCGDPRFKDIINKVTTRQTGVRHKICSQSFVVGNNDDIKTTSAPDAREGNSSSGVYLGSSSTS